MVDIWVPPSVRGLQEVAPGFSVGIVAGTPQPGPDDGLFLPPKGWGQIPDVGHDGSPPDPRTVPAVHVEYEPLRQLVLDGQVKADLFGFVGEWDGVDLTAAMGGPLAYLRTTDYHVYVVTADAPHGWVEMSIVQGFALHFIDPATGDPEVYLATGRMRATPQGLVLPPTRRAPKRGRNDPCWCGSGEKFKRCHGS